MTGYSPLSSGVPTYKKRFFSVPSSIKRQSSPSSSMASPNDFTNSSPSSCSISSSSESGSNSGSSSSISQPSQLASNVSISFIAGEIFSSLGSRNFFSAAAGTG